MVRIRLITPCDVDLGMRLKDQAGWNQTPTDWRRFMAMSREGCFVAECDGAAVGTTIVVMFDSVAWIAMVLVDAAHRGRGIGKALLQHALEFIDRRKVPSARLDATPLGQPLYEQLGFVPQYTLDRYGGVVCTTGKLSLQDIRVAHVEDYDQMLALDRLASGCDRSRLLLRLFEEQPDRTYILECGGRIVGFSTVRAGSGGWQVGPCVAEPASGRDLLRHACRSLDGESVLLDAPSENRQAAELARDVGLQVQRRFMRMCRGPVVDDDLGRLWASSGPELG